MAEPRPANWDWVKHTHECNALVMYGTLKTLAEQNVTTRNAQLGRQPIFEFQEIDGVQFAVGRVRDFHSRVFIRVTGGDAREIAVSGLNDADEVRYVVALDDNGICKFTRDNELFDAWQVLKAALEPLLFER